MKRYLLFAGTYYYPLEGWNDFKEMFESQFACLGWIAESGSSYDWIQIIGSELLVVV